MANIDCNACSDIRETAPSLIVNGFDSTMCTSLKNNTGLNPSSGHNDCEDLNDLNDCLVGNMESEVEAYDVCDWKSFMKNFIPNVWTTLKGIICAVCGLWTQIDKIWCWLNNMNTPKNYTLHAYQDDDPSKPALNGFRMAGGISTRYTPSNPDAGVPMRMNVSNNLLRITGSLQFDGNMPSSYTNGETVAWLDFFDGGTEIETSAGGKSWKGNAPGAGLFLYEYQINPCDYGFQSMWPAHLLSGTAGDFLCKAVMYSPGSTYPADNGEDDAKTYNPSDTNLRLIQVRLINMRTWGTTRNHGAITPNGITGVRPCVDSWEC